MRKALHIAVLAVCLAWMLGSQGLRASEQEYLDTFMKIRADASGKEVVFHWTGSVYSFIPGEKRMHLFDFEGFNVGRAIRVEDGFQLLTREAGFFKDPGTGRILEKWRNPLSNREVPVVHIWNDPVNQEITFTQEYLPYISKFLPSTDLGDEVCFNQEIFPYYTSPLPRKDFPEYSQSDVYQAAEFFQFFAKKSGIGNPELTSIPATISWTRISPWMPFMRMGDREGNLVFVCRGSKLNNGFADLPPVIKDYVATNNPIFSQAPEEYSEPNETSWTFFRKLLEQEMQNNIPQGRER
ncbi:MAG: DUF1838 family protein [Candidatus Cloacimonetes bacterium]|nr:DUF1838 family protein [Candidatus Cloacimonadota bacterium]